MRTPKLSRGPSVLFVVTAVTLAAVGCSDASNDDAQSEANSLRGRHRADAGATQPSTPATGDVCGTSGEDGTVSLACPSGSVISQVVFASYGTPQGACGAFTTSSCNAANSKSLVEAACLGKASCSVNASNSVFGDPCVAVYKALDVEVKCAPATGSTPPPSTGPSTLPSDPGGEPAKMADAFVDSIGINTHFNDTPSPYVTAFDQVVVPAFERSGIRHVRDGGYPYVSSLPGKLISRVKADKNVRIGFNLTSAVWHCDNIAGDILPGSNLSSIPAANIDSFEGLNEDKGDWSCSVTQFPADGPWSTQDRLAQTLLFQRAKADANLAGIPVIGPSLAWNGSVSTLLDDSKAVGDITAYMDYGNQHSYPDQAPSDNIQENIQGLAPMNGNKPMIATETGYCTDTLAGCPSERAAGKYYSRLYFEYLNAGVVRAYGYELLDDPSVANNDDAMGGWQANFGILHSDGTAKPSFTAIANEIALLNDPGAAFTPGALGFSLKNAPAQVHHSVFQKRNGSFYLALWQESDSYNHDSKSDVSVAPVSVDVTFVRTFAHVNRYSPLAGSQAVESKAAASSLTVSIPDEAVILELVP